MKFNGLGVSVSRCAVGVRYLALVLSLGLGTGTTTTAGQLAASPPDRLIENLERPQRVANQKVEEVIARLDLKPGLVVADIGAGTGVFSRPLAKGVGPTGKVYAVDILAPVLAYLDERAKQEQLTNIQSVLGEPGDPKLPANDVDLAFFNDVLHHIEHKQAYLAALAKHMKPGSRMAIVEFDNQGDPSRRIEGLPMLEKAEVAAWLAELGFHPVQEFPGLFTNKWYVIYQRR